MLYGSTRCPGQPAGVYMAQPEPPASPLEAVWLIPLPGTARWTLYGSSRCPGRPVKNKIQQSETTSSRPPPNQRKHTIHPWETFSFVITFTTAELSDIFNLSMKQQLNRSLSITKI